MNPASFQRQVVASSQHRKSLRMQQGSAPVCRRYPHSLGRNPIQVVVSDIGHEEI